MYRIGTVVYLNRKTECYDKILTINDNPNGNLSQITKKIQIPEINNISNYNNCNNSCNSCKYVFINNSNSCTDYLTINDLPYLIKFLTDNNYSIDTQITKILKNEEKDLLFYIKLN
jgi:hypothetical protein